MARARFVERCQNSCCTTCAVCVYTGISPCLHHSGNAQVGATRALTTFASPFDGPSMGRQGQDLCLGKAFLSTTWHPHPHLNSRHSPCNVCSFLSALRQIREHNKHNRPVAEPSVTSMSSAGRAPQQLVRHLSSRAARRCHVPRIVRAAMCAACQSVQTVRGRGRLDRPVAEGNYCGSRQLQHRPVKELYGQGGAASSK